MLERADALGGTWRATHYPGCACDVPTPYYSFSFAPKPDWSRFYREFAFDAPRTAKPARPAAVTVEALA